MKAVNWPAPGQRAAGCSRVARLDHLAGLVSLALSLVLIACAFPQPKILGTAIVFGASDYTLFKDLPATMADAIAMDALLTEQGWDSRLIVNTEATAARLKAELASLTGNTQPVLFYYAGHGYIEPEETFLVPVDASPFVDNLRPNLISSRDLHGWLVEYDIRHPILILDSCYSGGFAPGGVAYDGIPADYNPWVTPSEDTPAFSQVGALLAGAFQAWLGADNGSGAVVLTDGVVVGGKHGQQPAVCRARHLYLVPAGGGY